MKNELNDIKKLAELIKGIPIAMLTTLDEDETLHARPMAALQNEFDGELWFFTHASSHKVDEISWNRQVNVSYADTERNRYISVSGVAHLIRDVVRARQLWSSFLRGWFPKGVDDPELALIKVTVQKAEYWDSPNSQATRLLDFVQSALKGEALPPPHTEHRKLTFQTN